MRSCATYNQLLEVEVNIFGSLRFSSKKITKPIFLKKNRTETDSNQPVSGWFGSVN